MPDKSERIEIDITDELIDMARKARKDGLRIDAYEADALLRAAVEIRGLRRKLEIKDDFIQSIGSYQ